MRRLFLAGAVLALFSLISLPTEAAAQRRVVGKRGTAVTNLQKRRAVERLQKRNVGRQRVVVRRFHRLDRDGNGAISRQEWLRRPEVFDRLDTNKDGQLTPSELRLRKVRRVRRV